MQSEERKRIVEKLESFDVKIQKSKDRNRQCLTLRQESLRRRNQSLSEKLSNHRYREQVDMERTFEEAKEN